MTSGNSVRWPGAFIERLLPRRPLLSTQTTCLPLPFPPPAHLFLPAAAQDSPLWPAEKRGGSEETGRVRGCFVSNSTLLPHCEESSRSRLSSDLSQDQTCLSGARLTFRELQKSHQVCSSGRFSAFDSDHRERVQASFCPGA